MDGDEFSNEDLFLSALKDQVHTNVLSSTQIEPGPSDLPQHDISDIAVEDDVLADISYSYPNPNSLQNENFISLSPASPKRSRIDYSRNFFFN